MTADRNALAALIEAVEGGEWWGDLPRPAELHTDLCWKAFSGSLDAAKSLHEAMLPGWVARPQIGGVGAGVRVWHCTVEDWETGDEIEVNNMPDPARAWLLAVLKAIAAEGGE